MQIPTAVELVGVSEGLNQSVSLQSLRELHWGGWPVGSPVEYPQPRNRRSAKWVLKGNTAWYGQEKLWVSIAACLCLHLSLTHCRSFDSKKNKDVYIFIKKCCVVLLPSSWYTACGKKQPPEKQLKKKCKYG